MAKFFALKLKKSKRLPFYFLKNMEIKRKKKIWSEKKWFVNWLNSGG